MGPVLPEGVLPPLHMNCAGSETWTQPSMPVSKPVKCHVAGSGVGTVVGGEVVGSEVLRGPLKHDAKKVVLY